MSCVGSNERAPRRPRTRQTARGHVACLSVLVGLLAVAPLGCARLHAPNRPLGPNHINVRAGCLELGLQPVHAYIPEWEHSVAYSIRALNHCRRIVALDLRKLLVFDEEEGEVLEVYDPRGELREVTLDAFRESHPERLAFITRTDRRVRRVCVSLEQVAPGAPSTVYCRSYRGERTTYASLDEYRHAAFVREAEAREAVEETARAAATDRERDVREAEGAAARAFAEAAAAMDAALGAADEEAARTSEEERETP